MSSTRLLARFPDGIPQFSGSFGSNDTPPCAGGNLFQSHDYDLLWIVAGSGRWKLHNGAVLQAGRDDFILLPPFVPVVYSQVKAPLRLWYCHFTFRSVPSLLSRAIRDDFSTGGNVRVPMSFSRAEAPGVWRAYRALAGLRISQQNLWQLDRSLLALVSALVAFARSAPNRPGEEFGMHACVDTRVDGVLRRIDADPTVAWSVPALAHSAGLSPSHLHALLRKHLRYGVKRYLIEARLRRSAELLTAGSGEETPSVKAVSIQCGFTSQHYFARQFKTHFRVTPSAYRNGRPLL